ncbi:hypothetical protein AB3X83_00380 (plasmid) [Lentilactobacillus buchneri]
MADKILALITCLRKQVDSLFPTKKDQTFIGLISTNLQIDSFQV